MEKRIISVGQSVGVTVWSIRQIQNLIRKGRLGPDRLCSTLILD